MTAGFGLSSPAEGRLPRTWIALLAGRVQASLAASTGVEDAADVAAYLLAGADVVMTTSALAAARARTCASVLLGGLTAWMTRKGFRSPGRPARQARHPCRPGEAARERAGYVGRCAPPTAVSVSGESPSGTAPFPGSLTVLQSVHCSPLTFA